MDRIKDSGSLGSGSIPDGPTKTADFSSFLFLKVKFFLSLISCSRFSDYYTYFCRLIFII